MHIPSSFAQPENRWLERIAPAVRFAWRGKWPDGFVESARYLYDHELVLVSRGTCELRFRSRTWSFSAPAFFIIPPGEPHESKATGETVRDCLHFDWSPESSTVAPLYTYLPGRLRRDRLRPAPAFVPRTFFHGPIAEPARVLALAADLQWRWNQVSDAARLGARAVLLELLTLLLARGHSLTGDYSDRLAGQIRQLLERNLLSDQSVSEILRPLGCSHAHLGRVFKKAYRVTPLTYLNTLRLERARQLLREAGLSVTEAAYSSGFRDVSYFSRLFRRHTGQFPRDYRFQAAPVGKIKIGRKKPGSSTW